MWDLIVSVPDHCLSFYFVSKYHEGVCLRFLLPLTCCDLWLWYLSSLMTKPKKWHVHPAKTQISLGGWPVLSESFLYTQWVAKDPSFLRWAHLLFWWFCHEAAHFYTFCVIDWTKKTILSCPFIFCVTYSPNCS